MLLPPRRLPPPARPPRACAQSRRVCPASPPCCVAPAHLFIPKHIPKHDVDGGGPPKILDFLRHTSIHFLSYHLRPETLFRMAPSPICLVTAKHDHFCKDAMCVRIQEITRYCSLVLIGAEMVRQHARDPGGRLPHQVYPRHTERARVAIQSPGARRSELRLQVRLARHALLVRLANGDAAPRVPGIVSRAGGRIAGGRRR